MILSTTPARFAFRLLVVGGSSLCLVLLLKDNLISLLAPLFTAEMTLLDNNLSVSSLELTTLGPRRVLLMCANLVHPASFKGGVVYPLGWSPETAGWYRVGLNASAILAAPLVMVIMVLSWPPLTRRESAVRLACAAPLLPLLLALDKPLELLGNFQQAVIAGMQGEPPRPLFQWATFLEGGGSSALALAFAVMAVWIGRRACA